MRLLDETGVVVNFAVSVRVLDQRAEDLVAELKGPVVADHDFNAQRAGAGLDDVNGLRMAVCGDKKDIPALL